MEELKPPAGKARANAGSGPSRQPNRRKSSVKPKGPSSVPLPPRSPAGETIGTRAPAIEPSGGTSISVSTNNKIGSRDNGTADKTVSNEVCSDDDDLMETAVDETPEGANARSSNSDNSELIPTVPIVGNLSLTVSTNRDTSNEAETTKVMNQSHANRNRVPDNCGTNANDAVKSNNGSIRPPVNEGASTSRAASAMNVNKSTVFPEPSPNDRNSVDSMEVDKANREILRANRICATMKQLLTNIHVQVKRDNVLADTSLPGVKLYHSNLDKYWDQYFNNHLTRVCAWQGTEPCPYDLELIQMESAYNEVIIAIGMRASKLEADAIHHNSIATGEQSTFNREIKIGRIEIEIFDGDLNRWAPFKSMYEQLVHNKNYNTMTKFSYLLDHLKRDSTPYQIVDGFEKNPDGYVAAWQSLCDTFNNEHRLVMALVGRFLDMPSVSEEPNRTDLMRIVTGTLQLTLALPGYGVSVESWDVIIIALLLRKLDKRTKAKWTAANLSPELPKLAAFIDFIKARAASVEDQDTKLSVPGAANTNSGHQSRPQNNNNRSQSSNRQHHWPEQNQQRKKPDPQAAAALAAKVTNEKCPACLQLGHRLFACATFKVLTPAERLLKVNTLKVCVRCLRLGCTAARCTMGPCSCGQLHNKALCEQHARAMQQKATALAATTASTTAVAEPQSYL